MRVLTEATPECGLEDFEALRRAGEWGKARAFCFRMLARAETRRETFRWLENYAVCEWGRGDLSNALAVLDAAGELLDAADDRLAGNHFNNLGLVCRQLGRHDSALIHYGGADYHYEQAGRDDLRASVLNNIGWLLVEEGKPEEARGYLQRAAAVYESLGDHAHLAEVYGSLKRCSEALATAQSQLP